MSLVGWPPGRQPAAAAAADESVGDGTRKEARNRRKWADK